MTHRIAVIAGDGIGPEVIEAAIPVLDAAAGKHGCALGWERLPYGADHYLRTKETLPDAAFRHLRDEVDGIFLGALGDPRIPGNEHARDILLGLRFRLDLYVNFRPVRLLHPDLTPLRFDRPTIDFVIFRENTEGVYLGRGRIDGDQYIAEEVNTAKGVERIIRAAFAWAKARGRTLVTMSDKANAVPAHRVWQETFQRVAAEFPGITPEHRYVDALAMELVRDPGRFQVIVTNNLYGDILSDLGAGLVGGLGLAASANLHPGRPGLFEPVHGSAPSLAGKGVANPMAAVLTGALLFEQLGHPEVARDVERAVRETLAAGVRTPDIGGKATTHDAAAAVAARLYAPASPMARELRRVLGLRDLVLIVVGTTIGSGIFLVPGAVLRQSGTDLGVALLVWVAGSVLALLGALTFAELGAMLPDAGGSYVYVREAFGPLPAFLLGWTLFLAINTGSTATLATAFANYLGELAPLGPLTRKLAGVAMIAAVAAVNIRGVRPAATVQNWSTAVKVGAILALAAAGIALGDGWHRADTRVFATPGSLASLSAAGVALLGVLWAYEGWQNVTNSAGEARDPQRSFAQGIVLGTAALVAIYLTANVGYVAALGASGVAASDRVAADAVRALFAPPAAKLVTLAILVSIFSAANGLALTGPRMYFAMARDRVFFRSLAEVHPRFATPALAIAASAGWAGLLAVTGSFEQLFTYVVFASWLFAGLAAASVFVLRRRGPDAPRPFRVPGYPVTPALFIAAAGAIVVNTVVARPQQALAGLGIVLSGAPAYYAWRWLSRRALPSRPRSA